MSADLHTASTRRMTLSERLEHRTGLSPVGLGLLLAGIAAIAFGRVLGNPGLAIVGIFLLLAVLGTWLIAGRGVRIAATRASLPRRVPCGRVVDGGFELTSPKRLGALLVTEHFPAELREDVRVPIPRLSPDTPSEHRYTFSADHRGVYTIGPLTVVSGDPFGIVRRHKQIAEETSLVIHPRVDAVIDRIVARRWEDPTIRPPQSLPWPTGSEFYGMHEYQTGDDPRLIVWSALARHDTYMVREAEQGITDQVTILLDTEAAHYTKDAVCPSFEAAVRAAASVGSAHLQEGISTTVEANSVRIFEPARGRHHRLELLDSLAAVEREPQSLRESLDRIIADRSSDGHYVIITSRIDTATGMALRVLGGHGRSLLIVLAVNEFTDAATWHHASALRCAVVEVYGAEPLGAPFMHALGLGTS